MDSVAASLLDNDDPLTAEVIKLRDAVKEKERALAEKEQALSDKDQRIEQLLDYIVLLHKRQFGASADRPNKDQIPLFDEAELEQLMAELGLSGEGEESASSAPAKAKPPCMNWLTSLVFLLSASARLKLRRFANCNSPVVVRNWSDSSTSQISDL